tara:strand:+ start:2919 stop:4637 length:1719 start_codon:yes stop_codon:yes gene_type:complete
VKRKSKKKQFKKKRIEKGSKKTSIVPLLLFIGLLSLFSETMRTIPAGAISENFFNMPYELPKLNSTLVEKKYLNNTSLINQKINYQNSKNNTFLIEENFSIDKELIVAKVPEDKKQKIQLKAPIPRIVDVPKVEETIKVAAEKISTKTIIVDGEEKLIPGSSDKNITYMQILLKPNDLELNLKYAQQQGKMGNYKQTISTLERLNMLYPDNVEIKLYLLSVLVQADSPNKALTVIEEIKSSEDITPEDLETVNEIEEDVKARLAPKLWNYYADVSIGGTQNNNVNSVTKNRLQDSSDSVIAFNSPMYDRTYTQSLGLTASRKVGEASAFSINATVSDSRQNAETSDDFESYGLTFALDTTVGNQALSPYLIASKTDNQDDADAFSFMYGIGGSFAAGERSTFSYGYSYMDSKGNRNTTDTTADETNSISHGVTIGHDFLLNELISTSVGAGYTDADVKVDAGNDAETYDLNFRMNFNLPWAYLSVGDSLSWNDYKREDTSINSNVLRSDVTNTLDVILVKAVGEILPILDPNNTISMTLGFEKVFSEANIKNYDYISDSFSISFSKSFHLNK